MEIKHISAHGIGSLHWYSFVHLTKEIIVRNMLIDTGASVTTMDCELLAMLNYQRIDEFKELVRKGSSDIIHPSLAAGMEKPDVITLYGVVVRYVKVGNDDFPFLKVYTSLDHNVSNIIGMDVLRCYDLRLRNDEATAALISSNLYVPDTSRCAEIKILTA